MNEEDLGHNQSSAQELICMKSLGMNFTLKQKHNVVLVRWFPQPFGVIKINSDRSEVRGFIQGGAELGDRGGNFCEKDGQGICIQS